MSKSPSNTNLCSTISAKYLNWLLLNRGHPFGPKIFDIFRSGPEVNRIWTGSRVVKWARNPIFLFATLRKAQFHKLRTLRKLRIFIWINLLKFGQNNHKEDAPFFIFDSRHILSGYNFRNFHNRNLLENQIVLCAIATDMSRHSKDWIVLFTKLCRFTGIFAIHFTTQTGSGPEVVYLV